MSFSTADNDAQETPVITFFALNKFTVGLVSCLFLAVILFFIILAVILPLNKYGHVQMGDFLFIALPAWITIAVLLIITAEVGEWWIHPHWVWTSFKKVEFIENSKTNKSKHNGNQKTNDYIVSFTTGFPPFKSQERFFANEIKTLIVTSVTKKSIQSDGRFGLTIKLKNHREWIFFKGMKSEATLREGVRHLIRLMSIEVIDLTYGSKGREVTVQSSISITPPTELPPRGVREKTLGESRYFISFSRLHEWKAFTMLIGIWIGVYMVTWFFGWSELMKWGTWEGVWIFFASVLSLLFFKNSIPVREVTVDNEWFYYRVNCFGVPFKRKRIATNSITKITRHQNEMLMFRVIIIGEQTIKINDLNMETATYLERRLMTILMPEIKNGES